MPDSEKVFWLLFVSAGVASFSLGYLMALWLP